MGRQSKGGGQRKNERQGEKNFMNSLRMKRLYLASQFNILFIKLQKHTVLIVTNTIWSSTIISTTG